MSDDDGPSVFAEYIAEPEKERPEPELVWMSKDAAKPTRKLSPTQLLLNWSSVKNAASGQFELGC